MFKGALPHDLSWNDSEATATVRLPQPEPTVTISTRAAFNAVNSMFKASLPHEGLGGPGTSPAGYSKQGELVCHGSSAHWVEKIVMDSMNMMFSICQGQQQNLHFSAFPSTMAGILTAQPCLGQSLQDYAYLNIRNSLAYECYWHMSF